MQELDVTVDRVIKSRPLNYKHRDPTYPASCVPFYLYGTNKEAKLDHMLLQAPNTQLSADEVTFKLDKSLTDDQISRGLIVKAKTYSEKAMQPFPPTEVVLGQQSFFFQPGRSFKADVYMDPRDAAAEGPRLANTGSAKPIATGLFKLEGNVYVNSDEMNEDPFYTPNKLPLWKAEFDKIGQVLE